MDADTPIIKYLSGDERDRALAEAREKARMDRDSWLSDARYEGRQETKRNIAKNLLRESLSYEVIARVTGLSLEEVKQLGADLTN